MRPGRPRCPRRIEREPDITYFKPRGIPLNQLGVVRILVEELEAIRLTDIEGMEQEQAAQSMGISRRAFWEDLQRARSKIAVALVEGKAIRIEGGSYRVDAKRMQRCLDCNNQWEEHGEISKSQKCPECGSENISRDSGHGSDQGCEEGGGGCSNEGPGTPKADLE
jgi:uncharacterized protein